MYTELPQKIFGGDVVVRGRLKMRAFEFVSRNQTNFAISEVIEFSPTEYNFVRKGDSYEFDFPIQYKSNRNTIFELDSVSLAVVDTVSKKTIAEDRTYSDGLKVKLPKSFYDQQQNLKMYMDFQVHQRDPVYGVHLLYPEGNNGLHQSMNVVFEAKRGVLAWGPLGETLYKISASLLGPGVSLNTLFWILLPVVLLLIWFIIYIRRNYSITTAPSNITI